MDIKGLRYGEGKGGGNGKPLRWSILSVAMTVQVSFWRKFGHYLLWSLFTLEKV